MTSHADMTGSVMGTVADQEIANLSSKLSQVSDKFINQWTGVNLLQHLKHNEGQLRQFIKQAEDQIESLKGEMVALKQQASSSQLAVANQESQARDIEKAIEQARTTTEQLLFQKEQWEKQLVEETKQCGEQKELIEAQERATRQRLEALNKAEHYFKDIMALEFRKIDGDHLQFVFTNVDSKNHDRSFYLTIKIDNSQYQVTDCCPAIDGIPEMVAGLNKSNNLMKFVVEARKKFKLTTT
ncbi:kinetochore protein Spc25 [Strongylocentrotus purpuratus]|uniref:Kinetochore protein SPC25 n=1 Tax=Strongylocentrotus purpuratus TaxID=7668 RepID=A0A7M7LIN1_STRPU|nr:kinetochore protein Spc25 [Strongylocentrotus purpuratus]|eukprot:XP_001196956.1 PREDICTED: kinetochore protein Spc25 [Strongylocentrotus purpuratus]